MHEPDVESILHFAEVISRKIIIVSIRIREKDINGWNERNTQTHKSINYEAKMTNFRKKKTKKKKNTYDKLDLLWCKLNYSNMRICSN